MLGLLKKNMAFFVLVWVLIVILIVFTLQWSSNTQAVITTPTCPPQDVKPVVVEPPPWIPVDVDPCDVVIMLFTTKKYQSSRHHDIRNTWYKHLCQTDPDRNMVVMSDSDEIEPLKTYNSNCGNGYDYSMCCKVARGWKKAWELYPNKKWYVQADDDSYFHMKSFLKWLGLFDPSKLWHSGYMQLQLYSETGMNVTEGTHWLWYAVGWNTQITGASFKRLIESDINVLFVPICKTYFWPDVTVGLVLKHIGSYANYEYQGWRMGAQEGGYPPWVPQHKDVTVALHANHATDVMVKYEEYFYNASAVRWEDIGVVPNAISYN